MSMCAAFDFLTLPYLHSAVFVPGPRFGITPPSHMRTLNPSATKTCYRHI